MQIESLRSFITLVQFGSYTDAARALYVSQPTLSKRISALEKELGVPLLFNEKPLLLTEAGRLLMTYASSVVAQTDTLELQLSKLRGAKAELIRVQDMTFFTHFAAKSAQVKEAVRKQFPGVTFETVRCKTHQTPLDALLSHDLDIGVQLNIVKNPLDAPKPTCEGYEVQPFYGAVGELRLGVARDSAMASKPNLRLEDFAGSRFMFMADRRYESLAQDFRALCLEAGFLPNIEYVTTTNSLDFWARDYDGGVMIIDAVPGMQFTEVDNTLLQKYKAIRPISEEGTMYILASMITRKEPHGGATQCFIDTVKAFEEERLGELKGSMKSQG